MQEDNYNDQKGFLLLSSISVLTFACLQFAPTEVQDKSDPVP